jgi:hypothetical protein
MIGRKMLDDDKCHVRIRRHVLEKVLKGLQAAGGRSQRYDQELARRRGWYAGRRRAQWRRLRR